MCEIAVVAFWRVAEGAGEEKKGPNACNGTQLLLGLKVIGENQRWPGGLKKVLVPTASICRGSG